MSEKGGQRRVESAANRDASCLCGILIIAIAQERRRNANVLPFPWPFYEEATSV
jgi:hypothetical protein